MGGFGDATKYLYEKFILRDLLSFVTPGAIIVLTAVVLFLPEASLGERLNTLFDYSTSMHWLLYFPIFGLFFMVGFAVQCLGRIIGCIRIHLTDESTFCKRLNIFRCNWQGISDIGLEKAHKKVVEFHNATEKVDWAQQQHERLVILKQMCANGSLAIVIAAILILIEHFLSPWYLLIVGIPLLISIFWCYRVGELALNDMEEKILSELKKDEQKS